MTLIEGVGDEVLQFLVMTLLIGLTLVAWMSTNARPNRYRTLLVMRSHQPHPVTVSIRSGAPNVLYAHTGGRGSVDTVTLTTSPGPENNLLESGPVIPLQEMDSIVDADMALFDNNRLHFYRRVEQGNGTEEASEDRELTEEVEPASNAQIQEMDSIVSAMEADLDAHGTPQESPTAVPTIGRVNVTEVKDEPQQTSDTASAAPADGSTETEDNQEAETEHEREKKKILIKLKYLNDTLKEVEGSLDESLQDFKWRHFGRELATSRVLLIHGGRVLRDERASLRQLGLTHRAVVHALVQPPASGAAAPAARAAAPAAGRRLWDIENILMTLVSIALTVVWFFRCEYSNMFTASASVALFGLTVFYSVAIFAMYLSDTFSLDRRPASPPHDSPLDHPLDHHHHHHH